jgi:hypothetical protein
MVVIVVIENLLIIKYAQFVHIAIDSSQQVDLAIINDGSSMLKQNNRLILMR